MILDRILKGFWGRYALYLSAFVALYFLMREKLDSIIFGLWDSWITVGVNQYISIFLACLLSCYPVYNLLSKRKKEDTITASPIIFIFIPISVWFIIQKVWTTDKAHYLEKDAAFEIILYFTIIYLIMLIQHWAKKTKIDHTCQSFLLQDKPIEKIADDKLGFRDYANSIAKNIKDITENDKPYVFSVEGCWGSGKTSFVKMVKENLSSDASINIVDFNPWMSNSSQQITTDFFSRMAEETSDIRLKTKFRNYGKVLADIDNTGILNKIVDKIYPDQDLRSMLESINDSIKREDLRFVVFIDDMDRLDKEEIMSVLKMVRNTAEFYQTIFVLAYDRNYLDSQLRLYFKSSSIADSYIDKIVDIQFQIPSSPATIFNLLIQTINESQLATALPNLKIEDIYNDDIKKLFTTYRQIKRIHNAIAIDRELPHLNNLSFSHAVVFYYMQFYKVEEYNIFRDEYINFKTFKHKKQHSLAPILDDFGIIKRYITDRKDVKNIIDKYYIISDNENTNRADDRIFNTLFCCTVFLLSKDHFHVLKNQFDFLFKINAVEYKEKFKMFTIYDTTGFKGISIELTNYKTILNRLLEIRTQFNYSFYIKRCNELLELFTSGEKNNIAEKDLKQYYEFLLGLLLNINKHKTYCDVLIKRINQHYADYNWNGKELISILEWIGDTSNTNKHPLFEYFSEFPKENRYNLVSVVYQKIIYNLIDQEFTLPYENKHVLNKANIHLKNAINNELNYDTIEFAFYTCLDSINNGFYYLSSEACSIFHEYIEKYPDIFVEKCIKKSNGNLAGEYYITSHPYLMQIFNSDKLEAINYFNNVKCKNKKSILALNLIKKYLIKHIENADPKNPLIKIKINREDYELMFNKLDENQLATKEQQLSMNIN